MSCFFIRKYLNINNYIEVDLPILVKGENTSKARSFKTDHITVSGDLFLRKSLDLFLRELTVFDINKVYCIGKIFRNEHITTLRQPESQILSIYSNYLSVPETISFLKEMLITVSRELKYNDTFSNVYNQIDTVEFKKIANNNNSYICTMTFKFLDASAKPLKTMKMKTQLLHLMEQPLKNEERSAAIKAVLLSGRCLKPSEDRSEATAWFPPHFPA